MRWMTIMRSSQRRGTGRQAACVALTGLVLRAKGNALAGFVNDAGYHGYYKPNQGVNQGPRQTSLH
eukprot:COSAG01_NODE_5112_length_4474_cov_395.839771_1_plen_66_part_00